MEAQFKTYANQVYSEALKLTPNSTAIANNIVFEPVFSDEIDPYVDLATPRKIAFPYGFSMLVYRIVRLALASGPFYSEMYQYSPIDRSIAIHILEEIVGCVSTDRKQGGVHYEVHPQLAQMSELVTKDADVYFILHEICHVLIEDDKVTTLIQMLTWGTVVKIPDLSNILDHEILADRLASIFFFSGLYASRNNDYYEQLKRKWPNLSDENIDRLKMQDLGIKLVGIECGFFIQLILERYSQINNVYYLNFSDRVNWNRKFLVDIYGISRDVFFIPDNTIGFLMELLDELETRA